MFLKAAVNTSYWADTRPVMPLLLLWNTWCCRFLVHRHHVRKKMLFILSLRAFKQRWEPFKYLGDERINETKHDFGTSFSPWMLTFISHVFVVWRHLSRLGSPIFQDVAVPTWGTFMWIFPVRKCFADNSDSQHFFSFVTTVSYKQLKRSSVSRSQISSFIIYVT